MTIMTRAIIGLSLLLGALGACTNPLADRLAGEVSTTGQRVYRAAGIYGVVAGLACEYVGTPTALPGASARIAQVGTAAYDAVVEARAASVLGDAGAALGSLSGLLTGLAAETLEVTVDAPDEVTGAGTAGVAAYAVERALQVAVASTHLRLALTGLRGDLAVMMAEGRDPTEAEWADVMDTAAAARDCLAGGAGGAP